MAQLLIRFFHEHALRDFMFVYTCDVICRSRLVFGKKGVVKYRKQRRMIMDFKFTARTEPDCIKYLFVEDGEEKLTLEAIREFSTILFA